MTIYVDLVLFINFIIDFYIISGLKFLLNINVKLYRVLLGSLFGSLSIFLLFFSINTLFLNIIKIIISVFMIFISFGKKHFFRNLFYLYVISIILGGSLYLINDSLGYSVDSFMFINNGYSINLIILIIISPLIIYLYIREFIKYKKSLNILYDVIIKYKKNYINLIGYLDTGNFLVDPYFSRPIILVSNKYISFNVKYFYVPFSSLNNSGVIKCFIPEYIIINNKKYNNIVIGISENIKYDCVLNERLNL